ncbi:CLUMA_CG007027, isoform A [Clunio marinus]|uniref:CLUMA_CG007027, isoform A n=1 Tax=Clunio marinus TaxID=568069 RepID=A0A1J1HZU8_9DIPT|nr:CLUMA_CG007027, isoform A [Clunio marinus]
MSSFNAPSVITMRVKHLNHLTIVYDPNRTMNNVQDQFRSFFECREEYNGKPRVENAFAPHSANAH